MAKKLTRADKARRIFKAAQQKKGLTQADIAKRIGKDKSTVSRWYSDADNMTVGQFRLLCKVLSVPYDEILSLE